MMQVIKLARSTEFATKIRKVSNFCTEVIHFKLEALNVCIVYYILLNVHGEVAFQGSLWYKSTAHAC